MVIPIIKFIICAVCVFFCGKRVALYGDVIAEKTGLSGLWIGIVLVSVATSLPELFTGIGSSVFIDAPDLTVGNLFGANSYNLLNLVLLDFVHKGTPILSIVSTGQLLTASLSLIPLTIAILGIFIFHNLFTSFSILNISFFSIAIIVSYLISTRIIFNFEKKQKDIIKELKKEEAVLSKYAHITLKKAIILYCVFAVIIAGSGIWLGYIGEELADVFHVGQNYIGNVFLGLATTLPEITVSIAALRIGAKEMAVANMLGSNLFNISIIFVNDIFYTKAPIFNKLSVNHIFTGGIVVLMTAVVIISLITKPKQKTKFGISVYSFVITGIFLAGMIINGYLSK
jgi:cation:H+ antiporter